MAHRGLYSTTRRCAPRTSLNWRSWTCACAPMVPLAYLTTTRRCASRTPLMWGSSTHACVPLVPLAHRCMCSATRRCAPHTPLAHLGMCVRAAGSACLPLLLAQHGTSLYAADTADLAHLGTCAPAHSCWHITTRRCAPRTPLFWCNWTPACMPLASPAHSCWHFTTRRCVPRTPLFWRIWTRACVPLVQLAHRCLYSTTRRCALWMPLVTEREGGPECVPLASQAHRCWHSTTRRCAPRTPPIWHSWTRVRACRWLRRPTAAGAARHVAACRAQR